MRIIACVLLVAGVVSARTTQPVAKQADPAAVAPTLSADPSPSAAPAAAAAAPAAAAAAPAAAPVAAAPAVQQDKVFGPGLNNPLAIPPNPLVLQQAKRVAASNPNILVFVDTTGEVKFTDRFGREVEEIVDEFGRDISELMDPQEAQERLLAARRMELERRRKQLDLQLLQEYETNPAAFDVIGGGQAGTSGAASAQPTFRVVV